MNFFFLNWENCEVMKTILNSGSDLIGERNSPNGTVT